MEPKVKKQVKKVAKALEKASKAHAGQAKSLSKVLKNKKKWYFVGIVDIKTIAENRYGKKI